MTASSFHHLEYGTPLPDGFLFTDEKVAINLIAAPLYMSYFSFVAVKVFAFSLAFNSFTMMCLCVYLCLYFQLDVSWVCVVYIFHQIWDIWVIISSKHYHPPFSFSAPLILPLHIHSYTWYCLTGHWGPFILFFLNLFLLSVLQIR